MERATCKFVSETMIDLLFFAVMCCLEIWLAFFDNKATVCEVPLLSKKYSFENIDFACEYDDTAIDASKKSVKFLHIVV